MPAKEARLYCKLAKGLVDCEERSKLLRKMIREEIGFREEELFILNEMGKLKGDKKDFKNERRQFLALIMGKKLKDNISLEKNLRLRRDQARRQLEGLMGPNSTALRKIVKKSKAEGDRLRRNCNLKNTKKFNFLREKYGMRESMLYELNLEDQKKYGNAKVYSGEDLRPQKLSDPVIVCRDDEEILLSDDELSVLRLGPKFCEFSHLDEVNFEIEVEQTILKYKWDSMNDDDKKTEAEGNTDVVGDPSIIARKVLFEELFTREEIEDMEAEAEDELNMRDAQMRSTFDLSKGILDMRKRRATDVKMNSRVILPKKMRGFEEEAKLEMLRQELRGVYGRYMREKCGPRGIQKSNLSMREIKGLKSLKKRVKEGEIVILPTDKTGLFTVMSRDTYLACGLSHTKGDRQVDWDDLKLAQSELNGHTSMMIKIFNIGRTWEHTHRIRESMLGETMATCPLSLLYKDHKGWASHMGTCPPTRPVVSGNMGMNIHLSEVVSDLIEPLVDKYMGGRESISTEDMIAKFMGLNEDNKEWTAWKYYDGLEYEGYMGCSTCVGKWTNVFSVDEPELCQCVWAVTTCITRVTARWLKQYRRVRWEEDMLWDPLDEERTLTSTEVLPEDLQDYQSPMVVMGFDVVSLYPNLDTSKVGYRVKQAVLESNISWEGVNYMEACRYIALNWTEERCRSSKLRKILPWRRKNHGSRPGVRGVGPKGPEVGDNEQWIFPKVVLSKEDKLEIIGTVLDIATTAMFSHHYYSFGGRNYKQMGGGPTGLRGTCAIARLMMQIFDVKWEGSLRELCIKLWLNSRYMDDGRTALPPLKPGWRWMDKSLKYCIKWEREDQELSDMEITRRCLLDTLNCVEDYLEFTMETEEDFADKWLPTLDTRLRVSRSNQVLHGFFEKPTNSNVTIQLRSAMSQDSKIQVLSNDLIRRLKNSSEELGGGAKLEIVDNYTQKLLNSGYKGETLQRIITNGIKGYESKLRRCKEEGRKLHRSSTDSQGARIRKKLLAKSNWFRKSKKKEEYAKEHTSRGRELSSFGGSRSSNKLEVRTILFVEQSPKGELAKRLRDTIKGLEATLGFKVKVVERNGRSLGSKFPLNTLWAGAKCGRTDCTTCEQGGEEELPPCTRSNLVYENICTSCNPGATGKIEQEEIRVDIPTVYIGETSRSIFERSKEHWEGARKGCIKNHMVKHQQLEHNGEPNPNFQMKVRGFFRTALSRQVAEAVYIRRRGGEGAILNSKGEFSRSYIPRLQVPEEDQGAVNNDREITAKLLKEQDINWEQNRTRELGNRAIMGPKSSPKKRSKEQEEEYPVKKSKRRRKLKHGILKNWGELPSIQGTSDSAPLTPDTREPDCMEQEPDNGGSNPSISSLEPGANLVGRTLNVEQSRITDYYNQASSPTDKPSLDNQVAGHITPSRTEKDDRFGITTKGACQDDVLCQGGGGEVTDVTGDVSVPVSDLSTPETLSVDRSTTPSIPDTCVRKPVTGDTVPAVARDTGTDSNQREPCTFKRGGICTKHNLLGTKKTIIWKEWTKLKTGLFGYVRKQKTEYVCQYYGGAKTNYGSLEPDCRLSGVAKSNLCEPGLGAVTQTRNTALGGNSENSDTDSTTSGISRVGFARTGRNRSESLRISSTEMDPD